MPYIEREGGIIVGLLKWPRIDNQEKLPDDDSDVIVFRNRPEVVPVTTAEVLDAMKQIATGAGLSTAQKSKLTALITRLA